MSGASTRIDRTMTLSESTDLGTTATATEPTLMEFGVLNPSGFPTSKPLNSPLPEKTETEAPANLTGTFVTIGPTCSTPAFTTEPKNTNPNTNATSTNKSNSPKPHFKIFFIPLAEAHITERRAFGNHIAVA